PDGLGRPRVNGAEDRDPPRRAGVRRLRARVRRHRHRYVAARRRGPRRGRVPGDQRQRRAPVGNGRDRPASPAARIMRRTLRDRAAIAGIGQTEFSKASGRSELQLACEATRAALDDAGLRARDVDGLVTFTMDSSEEIEVARNLGIPMLTMFSRVGYGGGAACAVVMQAAMAVATGVAEVVVGYRAFNERSGMRCGGPGRDSAGLPPFLDMYGPYGLLTPASWVAMHARRYMHEYGVTNEDFGRISVVDRKHAATNPAAWFYQRPITLADHQSSRWIVEPVLRLLDCCQESDGGVALVVPTPEHARDLRQPPALIVAAAQGAADDSELMTSYYREDITRLPEMSVVADELWSASGLTPGDIQTAFLYDH